MAQFTPESSYTAESTAHGHEPDAVIVRAVYVDEDADQARREVEGALHNFLAYNAAPVASLPPKEVLEAKGYGWIENEASRAEALKA